ncbi:MAG: outer membrane lipoprotein carrier protein LolA [Alphaproteobacteria bacterium]|nr:outer membrane lipoprotein carrier protein LolA [Alphaproteobacteria bacterium]
MRVFSLPTGRRSVLAMTFAALVMATAAPRDAGAQTGAATLTPEQRADMTRIESYLSGVRTLRARFVQVASNGAYAEGTFYLSRPGRLRFQYDPPTPLLIVADGSVVYSYDTGLKQTTQIPINLTPLWFLLRERIQFTGDVTVTRFERQGGVIRIALVQTKDPAAGSVELAFQAEPLALRQWSVTDAQGITTNIALTETRQDVALDRSLFVFDENQPGGVTQHQ